MKKINNAQIVLTIIYLVAMLTMCSGIAPIFFGNNYGGLWLISLPLCAAIIYTTALTVVYLKLFDQFKD